MKSRLNGVKSQMLNFKFFFSVCLAKEILMLTDNLARKLQQKSVSASEGKEMYKSTVLTLEAIKSSDFEKFWSNTLKKSQELHLKIPVLDRPRRVPERFLDSSDEEENDSELPQTRKDAYKKIYYESFDLIIECLKNRFEQPELKMYENLQNLLLFAAKNAPYDEVLSEMASKK